MEVTVSASRMSSGKSSQSHESLKANPRSPLELQLNFGTAKRPRLRMPAD